MLSFITVSLFLNAGFVSVSIIWFSFLCLFDYKPGISNRLKHNYLLIFLVLIFSSYAIGICYSDDFTGASEIVLRKIHLLTIPVSLLICNKRIMKEDLSWLLGLFITICIIFSLLCLSDALFDIVKNKSLGFQFNGTNYFYFTSYQLAKPLGVSPVYLSLFCNFSLLIVLFTQIIKRSRVKTIVAVYLCSVILMIYSGAGIICMVTLLATFILRDIKQRLILSVVFGLIVIAGIVYLTTDTHLERIKFLFEFQHINENETTETYRQSNLLDIWMASIETIQERFVKGYGPADGQLALEETYQRNGLMNELQNSLNPHNEFLSTLLDLGLSGLIILLATLVCGMLSGINNKDWIAITFILMMTIFFCFESVLIRQKGIVFFALFYSIIFSGNPKQDEHLVGTVKP